jgi:HAE1 family hydrophobic/amphiphilic exporter-1
LKEIPFINSILPPGVEVSIIFEQSGFIQRSLGNLANTAVLAFIMASFVLLIFLRDIRASMIVALSIPLSMLFTFFVMYLLGLNLNIISLAGIALAVGMLVDNSIVVLENTVRFMEEGQPPMKAAVNGPSEILMAIVASTLTTVSVFVPVLFVPGIAGVMFEDMAITICVSLVASLFVATSLVPLMGSRLLKPEAERKPVRINQIKTLSDWIGKWFHRLEETYSRHLNWVLGHRKFTLGMALLVFIGSMLLLAVIDQEWLPESQEEQIIIRAERAPGTSIVEMEQTMSRLERLAMENVPEAYAVTTSYGPGEGFASFASTASNQGQLEINIVEIGLRDRDTIEIRDQLMPILEQEPGVELTAQLGGGMHMMTEGDLIIEIYGHDLEQGQEIALDLIEEIRAMDFIVHVSSSYEKGRPELEVKLNREILSSMGLSGNAVTSTLSTYMRGSVATWYTEGSREHEILVRADEPYRNTAQAISDLLVATPTGAQIPMADLVTLEPSRAPVTISRKNEQRVVYVNIDVEGAKLGVVTRQVRDLLERYEWPFGYQWTVGGAADDMMESFIWLFVALMGGSALVYMVMASQFESLLDPFIIIFTIPLGYVGVTWILFLTGTALSVVAMIGIIILVGIVVNNAIVLIDYIEQLQHRGMDMFEAVKIAGRRRLRPILMTALTTILAMVPLALEWGTGAEMWAPMARSVIGGLTASTFISLMIIPVVYTVFGSFRLRYAEKRMAKGRVSSRHARMAERDMLDGGFDTIE